MVNAVCQQGGDAMRFLRRFRLTRNVFPLDHARERAPRAGARNWTGIFAEKTAEYEPTRDVRFLACSKSLDLNAARVSLPLEYPAIDWQGLESNQHCRRTGVSFLLMLRLCYAPLNTKSNRDRPIRCSVASMELHASRVVTTASCSRRARSSIAALSDAFNAPENLIIRQA
jgi:hypothetical protein